MRYIYRTRQDSARDILFNEAVTRGSVRRNKYASVQLLFFIEIKVKRNKKCYHLVALPLRDPISANHGTTTGVRSGIPERPEGDLVTWKSTTKKKSGSVRGNIAAKQQGESPIQSERAPSRASR